MLDREKMVETILRYMCPFFSDGICRGEIRCHDDCIKRSFAKDAVNELIPDGAVVLTKEELVKATEEGYVFNTTREGKINIIEMAQELARKERAREIFEKIHEKEGYYPLASVGTSQNDMIEIAKIFGIKYTPDGVEVEE